MSFDSIFKVIDPNFNTFLKLELDRKDRFIDQKTEQIKHALGCERVYYFDDHGVIKFSGVSFGEFKPDTKHWMYIDKQKGIMRPKRSTLIGKELADRYKKITGEPQRFFKTLLYLNYNPPSEWEVITANRIRSLHFNFAHRDGQFCFAGYEGYKPPKGVVEITMSEYRKFVEESEDDNR